MNQGRQAVVSIVRSETAVYDDVDFKDMVRRSLLNMETHGVTAPSSGTVFIKPNMVSGATAKSSITTEPRFIGGLVALLKERGVKKIYVGDSSASFAKSSDAYQSTGLAEAVERAGGEMVDIDDEAERVEVDLPGSDILARVTVPRKAYEADAVINFAKLKTHRIANSVTCATKNWVGFIDQDTRLKYHQTRLPKLVSEFHKLMPETLCFGDAVIIGDKDGPDFSTPRFLGVLLCANDPVALDVIGAELLSVPKGDLLFPWTAYYDGVGEIERNKITVVGPDIQDLAIRIEKPVAVLYNRFPCNVVLGGMCDGCFAWIMGPAIAWEKDGTWEKLKGKAPRFTIMLGFNADDVLFEKHLQEGPYFVIGDCTPARFREDPRTVFIPGCCPGPDIPATILKTCGVE